MWSYLEHLSNLLENAVKVLSAASSGDVNALRNATGRCRDSSTSLSSLIPFTDRLPQLTAVGVPGVTGNRTYLL